MENTVSLSQWLPQIYDKFSSLLSVSILPAEFWQFLGIDGIWISKIVYPFIFSFVPVIAFKLYRTWVDQRIAFFGAFFLIANSVFFTEMITLGRQMLAEFFLVLVFFLLFSNKIKGPQKTVLFIMFSFAMIASHYAVAEIFLFIIALSWLLTYIIGKKTVIKPKISIYAVIIFASIMFGWYIFISSSATFGELTNMLDFVYRSSINNFFDFGSRGDTVLLGVGVGNTPTTWLNLLGRLWAYAAELLLVVGYFFILFKRKIKLDKNYAIIMALNMVLLILSVVLPSFAGTLGMSRLYHIVLIFTAPLMIIGVYSISKFIFKSKKNVSIVLSLLILIPFFLFQTGVFYEVSQVQSYSVPLSRYRFDADIYSSLGLIEKTDISGVQWISSHDLNGTAKIFSDEVADSILVRGGYGLFPLARTQGIISNTTTIGTNSIVYLRYYNLKYNLLPSTSGELNTDYYYDLQLTETNKIYSNGMCDIYQKP